MFLQEGGKGSLPLNKILCEFKLIAETMLTRSSQWGELLFQTNFMFAGTSLGHLPMTKSLKIEPVFALKLDKGKVLGDPPPWALSKN